MSKFKMGSSIVIYNNGRRYMGSVRAIDDSDNSVLVECCDDLYWVHEKQCRRLVKRSQADNPGFCMSKDKFAEFFKEQIEPSLKRLYEFSMKKGYEALEKRVEKLEEKQKFNKKRKCEKCCGVGIYYNSYFPMCCERCLGAGEI
jgi:hypothetical protein